MGGRRRQAGLGGAGARGAGGAGRRGRGFWSGVGFFLAGGWAVGAGPRAAAGDAGGEHGGGGWWRRARARGGVGQFFFGGSVNVSYTPLATLLSQSNIYSIPIAQRALAFYWKGDLGRTETR